MTRQFDTTLRIEWIPVKNLSVVWVQAQRPFRKKRAQKIADNFDPDRFDPIRVTLPNGNGMYHIIDGQTRKEAIVMLWGEDEKAPCVVLDAEDPTEAAKLFDGINGTRWSVDPISRFKVRVTAGEPKEIAITRIVHAQGYKIGQSREASGTLRYISAVTGLMAVFEANGPEVLNNVLQILSATWPSDPVSTNGNILRAYGAFMTQFGSKVNWGILKDCISKKFTPGSLLNYAKGQQDVHGGAMPENIALVLLATYNKNLSADKKLKKA